MGAKPRVGRPRKNVQRVELRMNADDPMTRALIQEAERRHITLQQHITDILTARYLNQGVPPPEPPLTATDAASALAEEWMG